MPTLRFKHFIRTSFLRRLGRPHLAEFFGRFEADLQSRGLRLPGAEATDEHFYGMLARMVASPEGLPEELSEGLFAIDEMSGSEVLEQLEGAAALAGVTFDATSDATRADFALQLWLAAPGHLARLHNQQRLRRLTAFECFGPGLAQPPLPPAPDEKLLREIAAALDPWFARHHRGHNTTRLEVYPIEGDYWFLVRHGDTFTRAPKVEAQKTEIIHFRPERDDVVVYSPEHEELRINARTRGERRLYVETFGRCLRGRDDWFSRRRTYTLEPLRTEGPEALDPTGLDGLSKITLRELELVSEAAPHEVLTREAEDLFGLPGVAAELTPPGWRLARAGFEVHFTDQARPRPVQIRPPNLLKLGRHCDLRAVDRWMCQRGFRVKGDGTETQGTGS